MTESEGEAIRRASPTILGWDIARPGSDRSVVFTYDRFGKLKFMGRLDEYPHLELQPDGTYAPRPRVRAEG